MSAFPFFTLLSLTPRNVLSQGSYRILSNFYFLEKETIKSHPGTPHPPSPSSQILPRSYKATLKKRHWSKTEIKGIYLKALSSSSEKEQLFQKLKFKFCTVFSLDYPLCSSGSPGSVLLRWGKNAHFHISIQALQIYLQHLHWGTVTTKLAAHFQPFRTTLLTETPGRQVMSQ